VLTDEELAMFDFNEFEECLYEECLKAFPAILNKLSGEHVYFLGLLYNGSQWSSVQPSVSTSEGLSELVQEYGTQKFYQDKPIELIEEDVKWSPLECKQTHDCSGMLPKTVERLNGFLKLIFNFSDEEFDS